MRGIFKFILGVLVVVKFFCCDFCQGMKIVSDVKAIEKSDSEIARCFLNALKRNDADGAIKLIKSNPEMVSEGIFGELTPLHCVALEKIVGIDCVGAKKITRALVLLGADINARVGFLGLTKGLTPLCIAAGMGNVDLTLFFIELGAKVNALRVDNLTPLHCAVEREDILTAFLLICAGANIYAQTKGVYPFLFSRNRYRLRDSRLTALHLAAWLGRTSAVSQLLSADKNKRRALMANDPIQMRPLKDWKTNYGNTSAGLASLRNHEHVLRLLGNVRGDIVVNKTKNKITKNNK